MERCCRCFHAAQFFWEALSRRFFGRDCCYSILELLNPLLNQRIDWAWFIASQFAFGIVAGLVVVRQERVRDSPVRAVSHARGN